MPGDEREELVDPADFERVKGNVDSLLLTVETIVDILTQQPGGPWAWELLEDDARLQLWDQLFKFVDWLDVRYLAHLDRDRYQLTECWYRHSVAVELVTALMVARISVYQESQTVASFGLVEWHERCLWPTLDRLKTLGLFKPCQSNHDDGRPHPLKKDRAIFDEFLASELAAVEARRAAEISEG